MGQQHEGHAGGQQTGHIEGNHRAARGGGHAPQSVQQRRAGQNARPQASVAPLGDAAHQAEQKQSGQRGQQQGLDAPVESGQRIRHRAQRGRKPQTGQAVQTHEHFASPAQSGQGEQTSLGRGRNRRMGAHAGPHRSFARDLPAQIETCLSRSGSRGGSGRRGSQAKTQPYGARLPKRSVGLKRAEIRLPLRRAHLGDIQTSRGIDQILQKGRQSQPPFGDAQRRLRSFVQGNEGSGSSGSRGLFGVRQGVDIGFRSGRRGFRQTVFRFRRGPSPGGREQREQQGGDGQQPHQADATGRNKRQTTHGGLGGAGTQGRAGAFSERGGGATDGTVAAASAFSKASRASRAGAKFGSMRRASS